MSQYKKYALGVIFVSILFRIFMASMLEFGNDEVYYWLYAKYPGISHFDHPPMVGFFIQFFTANLLFDSELFIRLAAIVPASFNMYLIYKITTLLKNEQAGLLSVILYNLNFYSFIISGTFILPDAPLLFFWLLSFYYFLKTSICDYRSIRNKDIIFSFLFLGCAIYSKYQAVYLLVGIILYSAFFNKNWFKNKVMYLSLVFPILAIIFIFYWNYENNFISFSFHKDRISLFSFQFNKDSFFREIFGQMIYNNPYIYMSIIVMFIDFFNKKNFIQKKLFFFFLSFSLPLIFTVIYLSFSRNTLPHWSGISYVTLLPLLAIYLSNKKAILKKTMIGFCFLLTLLTVGVFVINEGWFLSNSEIKEKEKLGNKDVTMDFYGWKQSSLKIKDFLNKNVEYAKLPIVSNKWYPGTHIHYYIAKPLNMSFYALGDITDIHKYYWINNNELINDEVLFVTDSRNFIDPNILYKDSYLSNRIAAISVLRGESVVKYVFIYKMIKTHN